MQRGEIIVAGYSWDVLLTREDLSRLKTLKGIGFFIVDCIGSVVKKDVYRIAPLLSVHPYRSVDLLEFSKLSPEYRLFLRSILLLFIQF